MIPSSHFHLEADTAWWVTGDLIASSEGWALTIDRPCDTCDGERLVPGSTADELQRIEEVCPSCDGTGRHTFDVEVECLCEPESGLDGCEAGTYRVHVISGMVLPIVETIPASTSHLIENEPAVFSDPEWRDEWFIRTTDGCIDSLGVTLPSAAAPGMFAVKLGVHS